MPVNLRQVQNLIQRSNQTDPREINRQTASSFLNDALRLLNDISLAPDESVVSVPAESMSDLNDQIQRPEIKATFRSLLSTTKATLAKQLAALDSVPFDQQTSLTIPQRDTLRAAYRKFRSLEPTISALAEQDVDPVTVPLFRDTGPGRAALANAVQAAQKQYGGKPSVKARQAINKQVGQALLSGYKNYLDAYYPTNQSDEARPTLSVRDALAMGQQLHEAMAAQHEEGKVTAPLALQVCQALVGGQNTLRYNLPAVEGIALPEFWQQRIDNGFKNDPLLPNLAHLQETRLRDLCPASTVLESVIASQTEKRVNPINPVIRYLDTETPSDDEALLRLGGNDENTFLVLPGDNGQPVIVTLADPRLPSHLLITSPEHRHQIAYLPDSQHGDLVTRADTRKRQILEVAAQLDPLIDPVQMGEKIRQLHREWNALVTGETLNRPATLQSELGQLHGKMTELARGIRAPGYFDQGGHRDNAKQLVILAMLSAHNGSDRQRWTFQTPNGTNTRASIHPPALRIVTDTLNDNGTSELTFQAINQQGKCVGHAVTRKQVPSDKRSEVIANTVMEMAPESREVGKLFGKYPGLVTFALTPNGESIQTGHWLDQRTKAMVTESSPLALTETDLRKQRLFLDNEYRVSDRVSEMIDAATYLIHGTTIDPDTALWVAEMASYDGDFALIPNMDDFAGSPKARVPLFVFEHATTEDIRRALMQAVALSGIDETAGKAMIERIRSTDLDQAIQKMNEAREDAHSGLQDDQGAHDHQDTPSFAAPGF